MGERVEEKTESISDLRTRNQGPSKYMTLSQFRDEFLSWSVEEIGRNAKYEDFPVLFRGRGRDDLVFDRLAVTNWFSEKEKGLAPPFDWKEFKKERSEAHLKLVSTYDPDDHRPHKTDNILSCMKKRILQYSYPTPHACVYFLLNKGKIVYVGQSQTLYSRISTHMLDRFKVFDEVYYFDLDSGHDLDLVESAFIAALKPKHNRRHPTLCERRLKMIEHYGAKDLIHG